MKMSGVIGAAVFAVSGSGLGPPPAVAADIEALRAGVQEVFESYCVRCHQEDPAVPNRKIEKFGFILDLDRLETSKYVVPGDPDASELYTSVRSDEMPEYADIGMTKPVPDDGKQMIRDWILALGEGDAGTPATR